MTPPAASTPDPARRPAARHAVAPRAPVPAPRRATAQRLEPLWTTLFDPARFATLRQMAGILLRSGFLPSGIRTEEQVITILIKGYELGIPPMEALSGIHVIQGKPSVSPQLMLALINRSGELRDLVVEGDSTQCTVTMTRRGRTPHTETFTIEDARRLTTRDRDKIIPLAEKSNWREQPAVMLRWRAIAACARIVFPDVISGLYTTEEMGADITINDDGDLSITETIDVEPDAAVDPATGEVREDTAPSPTPISAPAVPSPSPASDPETAAPSSTPISASAVTSPAPASGPETAVPDPVRPVPAHDLSTIRTAIAEAARLAGTTPRAWVNQRYGEVVRGKRLEQLDADTAYRILQDALADIAAHDDRARRRPADTSAAPLQAETSSAGAGDEPAPPGAVRYETDTSDASSPSSIDRPGGEAAPVIAVARADQPATPDQLDSIRHECTIRGIVHPERDPLIRMAVRAEVRSLEDLTYSQADRVLRALRYHTPLRSPLPTPP